MGAAPRIETARLILRAAEASDFAGQFAMLGDPAVMRFVGGKPLSREEAWRKLLQTPGLWALLGYGYWTVESREGRAYLGQIGFADFKRDLLPSIEGLPEMGWMFAAAGQGKGYAAEAAEAALAWADETLAAPEIVAIVDPGNERSIRLAERCGFRRAEATHYAGDPVLIFRRTR